MGMHDLFGVVDDPVTEAANAALRGGEAVPLESTVMQQTGD